MENTKRVQRTGVGKVPGTTSKLCIICSEVDIDEGIKEEVFSWKKEERLEIGLGKIPANREDNSKVEEEEYGQDSNYDDLNYDLNYIENTKGYQKSRWSSHIELTGKRPELFRINEYSDLVIIVDDRNMEYVFGPSG
ncbi:hypothetical protein RhiirA4_454972 [Rhizophagus irregularis]|uniref:Uncharacterized protein n=1 Tax=Rhizophagus irregularis TaxID=588596 RepID=A0A2I1G439_9GLOM|nr:hypothetical protein RhiirA4_454972 [Rhizophagus irregularis]